MTVKHAGPYATFGSWSLQIANSGKEREIARRKASPGLVAPADAQSQHQEQPSGTEGPLG